MEEKRFEIIVRKNPWPDGHWNADCAELDIFTHAPTIKEALIYFGEVLEAFEDHYASTNDGDLYPRALEFKQRFAELFGEE